MTRSCLLTTALCTSALAAGASHAHGFAYTFANGSFPNTVTHSQGYNGTGGVLNISVGIDPTSAAAAQMVIPTQNAVMTWDNLVATDGNLQFTPNNNVPFSKVDFESVLIHEMGHALGLDHPNLASESGLPFAQQDGTQAAVGPNGVFNVGAGADGVFGSPDDVRGDDVNLNYFKIVDNNPFNLPVSGIVDSSTYSRNLALLPLGDLYSANAARDVAGLPRYSSTPNNTEAVMQQGSFNSESQRTLGADDVAGIRYAQAGLDEVQGTLDDYTINLTYAGLTTDADIVVDFDSSRSSFAVTFLSATLTSPGTSNDHLTLVDTEIGFTPIYFSNPNQFFFNDVLIPEPGTLLLLSVAGGLMLRRRRA